MTPIVINKTVSNLSAAELQEKLNYLSYTFCVNADFTKTDAVANLVNHLESHVLEALLRIFEKELGYVPFQNKIYEKTEGYFGKKSQHAYNICRMMSSLRRIKHVPLDPDNEKYLSWVKNRVKYGIKQLIIELKSVGNMVRSENDNVRTPATV